MQIGSPQIHPTLGLACLHIATLQRNQPLMELLLENGADIDVQVRWPVRTLPSPGSAPGPLPGSEVVALTLSGAWTQHALS